MQLRLPPVFEYQRQALFGLERYAVVEGTTKAGKAQPLDATVYTPSGPITMGQVQIGDEVCTPFGTSRVREIHPQGEQDIYEVTFADGSRCDCTNDHLWEVHSDQGSWKRRNRKRQGPRRKDHQGWPRLIPLSELRAYVPATLRRIWVTTAPEVTFTARPTPIDPYVLGVLISEGCLRNAVSFSSGDAWMIDEVRRRVPPGYRVLQGTSNKYDHRITLPLSEASKAKQRGTHLYQTLRTLGLAGKLSQDKFIPECYRYNTPDVRWQILRGIMDGDGFVDKHGQPNIEQTSPLLAQHITEIAESLGATVITTYKAKNGYLSKKTGKRVWGQGVHRQKIRHSDGAMFFTLPRKKDACRPKKKRICRTFRSITLKRRAQAQCITIEDARGLYLTDRMLVTHNSIGCLIWLLEEAGRFKKPGANFWWVAPTQTQAEIMYARTKAMMLAADPDKRCWDSHDTKYRITLKGCGFLWFKTGEKPDNLYGEDVYAAVMDEFTRQREAAWFALRTTLTATKGRCRFIGNVKGRQNWGYQWARKAEAGSPNMTYAKITCEHAVAAGIMDQEEVDQAERDLPHAIFRELYYAEASDDGSNPFGLTAIKACLHPLHTQCEPVAWGWDLARARDWTVGIGLCEHGKTCRFERWNKTTLPVKEAPKAPKAGDSHREYWAITLDRVRKLTGDAPALVDSTSPGGPVDLALSAHGQLNIEGYVFSSRSKQQLMEGLALSIQREEVGFPDGIIRSELELFGYEHSASGIKYTTMEGAADDTVCSLALAVEAKKRAESGTAKTCAFDKATLKALTGQCRRPAHWLTLTTACGWDTELAAKIAKHDPACLEASKGKWGQSGKAGAWSVWCPLDDAWATPSEDHPYVIAAAVGAGTPGSATALKVADAETRAVVAEIVLEGVPPEQAAKTACLAGLHFQGPQGRARLIWAHEGPGVAFGETIRRVGYGRVYRFKSEGDATGEPGWRWSKHGILTLHSELKNAMGAGRYVERSEATAAAAKHWIFSDNGTLTTQRLDRDTENPRCPSDLAYAAMLLAHALAWGGAVKTSGPRPMHGSIAWQEAEEAKDKRKKQAGRYQSQRVRSAAGDTR